MERGNSKHGPRLDEQMERETRAIGAPTGMTPEEREERSRLGRYLRRTVFPADRAALVAEAASHQAPDAVVAKLRSLPEGPAFQTVAEVWAAYVRTPEDQLERRF